MAKVLISLVGGRPLPNIIAALYFQPEYLYFIVSRDSRRSGGDYEKTIAALPQRLKSERDSTVNPYSLQDTIDHCRAIIQKHKEDEIIINATLGPKTMAFGAYEAAREFKQQGLNIEVCYLAPQGLVWVFREPHEPEPVKIGLKQYFNSYGWNVSCKNHDVTDNFRNLVQFMVANLPMSFLTTFRKNSQGSGKKTHKCSTKEIGDDKILRQFEELGFISNVRRDDQNAYWTINSSEDRELLIKGDWLEYYVYATASTLTDS